MMMITVIIMIAVTVPLAVACGRRPGAGSESESVARAGLSLRLLRRGSVSGARTVSLGVLSTPQGLQAARLLSTATAASRRRAAPDSD
jgi:hypothetical protein